MLKVFGCVVCILAIVVLADRSGRLEMLNSLRPPFMFGRGAAIPGWDFGGSVVVTSDLVRLTPDRQSRRGWLWNTHPVVMKAWEVELEFAVHGQGKHTFGDGFAFWYTEQSKVQGPVYGNQAVFKGLAIVFDSFDNDQDRQNPYVMIAMSNGTAPFDYARDGKGNRLDGCRADFRNAKEHSYAKIVYINGQVDLLLALHGKDKWSPCASARGVVLPTGYYFGITAETGDVADNHDVFALQVRDLSPFHSDEKVAGLTEDSAIGGDSHAYLSQGGRSWFTTFVYLAIFGGIVFAVYAGFKYSKEQERKRMF